jgi:hypothetical protein
VIFQVFRPKIQHQVSFRQISGSYSVIKLQFGFQVLDGLDACRKKADYRCGRFSLLEEIIHSF